MISAMSYKGLSHFISVLDSAGELIRIRSFVSPRLEMTEIADRVVKHGGKALLFENNGTEFPLLINAFGSERRMCLALGVRSLDETGHEMSRVLDEFLGPHETLLDKLKILPALQEVSSWMPKRVSGRGACQEVVMPSPDLTRLPVMTCWPADGGPFITLPVVHTRHPVTGIRNTGMYRMQVFGRDATGMHWHLHKGSARHFDEYKKLNRKMPVTVILGGDPVYTYAATAPLPENIDEYLFAGFLRKKKVELVRCLTNDLEVPADADFVIEGYVDPSEAPVPEGPFGDHTGFYSLPDLYPVFHVTCITHRKNAVYPSTVVGIPPMEDGWIGKATERIFLVPLRLSAVPELQDLHMPVEGVFHNLVLVRILKHFPGQGLKVMNSLWGAGQMMFNKILVVFSGNEEIGDYDSVARIVSRNVDPLRDIQFVKGPVDVLDHSSRRFAFGSKLGLDATEKLPAEQPQGSGPKVAPFLDEEKIKNSIPEIVSVNGTLPARGISVVLFTVRKMRKNQVREHSRKLVQEKLIRDIRFVVFLDEGIDLDCLADVVWIGANNLDPERDCFILRDDTDAPFPALFMDATRKSPELDLFERDWPNIIVMDDATIRQVDEKWILLGLGAPVPSPSLKYKTLVSSSKATF